MVETTLSALDFSAGLAHQAGALLLDMFHRGHFNPTLKADRSVVTEADFAADRLIADAIHDHFPEDALLSEEATTAYTPTGPQTPAPAAIWVVDPLDGTTNFSLGLPHWGVLIARLVDGRPHTAAMYFPVLDELYTAQRGQGAAFNGRPLHTPTPGELSPVSIFACCTRTAARYSVSIPYKQRILGASGYTLAAIARGMAVVGFESTPKVWDLAAGWLIVEEAGAVIETYQPPTPFPLRAGIDYARQSFPLLAAANASIAAMARRQIQPKT